MNSVREVGNIFSFSFNLTKKERKRERERERERKEERKHKRNIGKSDVTYHHFTHHLATLPYLPVPLFAPLHPLCKVTCGCRVWRILKNPAKNPVQFLPLFQAIHKKTWRILWANIKGSSRNWTDWNDSHNQSKRKCDRHYWHGMRLGMERYKGAKRKKERQRGGGNSIWKNLKLK